MIQPKSKIDKIGWSMLALLFGFQFINLADKAIFGLVAVPAMKDLNLTMQQWGLIGSAFFWLYAVGSIVGGMVGDKFGMKKTMGFMASIWSIVQYVTIFVMGLPALLVSRVILGFAEGPNQATTMAMVGRFVPKVKFGLGAAITILGGNIGSVVIVPIIVAVMYKYGWRATFVVTGTMGLIWMVLWQIFGREYHPNLKYEIAEKDTHNKVKLKDALPSMFNRNFLLLILCAFTNYWALAMGATWNAAYLRLVFGLNEAYMAIINAVGVLAMFLIPILSDYVTKKTNSIKKGRAGVMAIGLIIGGFIFYILTLAKSPVMAVTALGLAYLGQVFITVGPPTIMSITKKEYYGSAIGIVTGLGCIGSILAPAVAGSVIGNAATKLVGFSKAYTIIAIMEVVVGILILLFFKNPEDSIGLSSPTPKNEELG